MTVRARLLFAAGMLIGTLLPITPPAGAAAGARVGTPGACPTLSDGVTVVVDPGPLGGPAQIRCAPGAPSSGLAALQAAGFSYAFVPGQPGMVCVIGGEPDPCNGAPGDAYWAYHHASRGGAWTYSTIGAGSRKPPVGSVEGWAFGGGDVPSTAPPAKPAVAPSPSPAPAPAPSPPAPIPAAPNPAAPPPAVIGAPSTSTADPAPGTAPSTTSAAPETTRDTAATSTSIGAAAAATDAHEDTASIEIAEGRDITRDDRAEDGEASWGEALALLTALLVIGGLIVGAIYIRLQIAKEALGDIFKGPEDR